MTTNPELWNSLSQALPKTFSGRVLLVGGSVRDYLLDSKVSADIDLVVERSGGAEELARTLSTELAPFTSKAHALGQGYPIWQLVWKLPEKLQAELGFESVEIQIADTQMEMFPDPTTRQRVTRFGSLSEDCARRDFSVNMLYWDLRSKQIVDPSGVGLRDLKAKRLGPHPEVDPAKIFRDDPLRMLRLLRFEARLSFSVDDSLWKAFDQEFSRVTILSRERVRDEFLKITDTGRLAFVLERLRERACLGVLFEEFCPMIGCEQDRVYHSEGDVWTHTLMVMQNAPKTRVLQLAALLHDVGKPATREERAERVSFLLHEKVSTELARAWFEKWRFPRELRDKVLRLVALHLRGGDVMSWKSPRPARKLLRDAGEDLPELLQLIEADSRSSLDIRGQARTEHLAVLRARLKEAEALPTPTSSALSGSQIMKHFGVSQGPEVRRLKDLADGVREEMLLAGEEVSDEAILQKVAVLRKN